MGHSLHQLLYSEQPRRSDTPITPDQMDVLEAGLGESWMEAIAPQESHKLERRFAWSGLGMESLQRVLKRLSLPPDAPALSPWVEELQALQASLRTDCECELKPSIDDAPDANAVQLPFSDLWLPVVDDAVARLRKCLTDLDQRPIKDAVFDALGQRLLSRLSTVSEQVLFEQFNLLRPPGVVLLAHLGSEGDGNGPPARDYYCRFIRDQRRDGLSTLLESFPVLGRYLGLVCLYWRRSNEQLLRRVDADADPLQKRFGVTTSMALCGIQQGLSDPHNGGQAVSVLRFASEEGSDVVRVVYKPKDMRVDSAYQQTLKHLNRCSDLPPLRNLSVHCGDDYGYMEHVQHRLCEGDDQLKIFYRNAGRLTAVLYLLGCTDCHHENLIACDDQLLLIDTETLLEADLRDHISDASNQQTTLDLSELQKRFQSSVLRSGLLPNWLFVGQAKTAVDISALGITPPSEKVFKVPGWLGLNSDGMMAGRIQKVSTVPTSLPVGVGGMNGLNAHLETFCQGFREQCSEFVRTRQEWIKPDGMLEQFRGLPRRIVLRATRVYFALQRQQLEPAALRSPLRQGLVLEQLCRSYLLASDRPLHWPVFEAELRQMERLDIPFFVHGIDGRDLPLGDDLDSVKGFIETSGLESSRQRIAELDEAAIAFQEQLIRGSSRARITREQGWSPKRGEVPETAGVDLTSKELRQEARRQLDMLEEIAIRDPDGLIDWLGMDLGSDGESFTFGPVGTSLYGGTAGVALLAAHFADEVAPAAMVQACLTPLLQIGEADRDGLRMRWWRDLPLGLSGCAGNLLILQELATWGPESLRSSLQSLQTKLIEALLPEHIHADRSLDLIGGVAGLIGPLLRNGSSRALEMALLAGDQLLDHQGEEGGWSIGRDNSLPLLGFSHGTAGYAAALANLGERLGEQRFFVAASRGLAYERDRFDDEHGNWPDYRYPERPARFMTSWCHGAPGIALSRACLFGTSLWDDTCLAEMATALKTLIELDLPFADHLCCGTFGNASILRLVAEGPWAENLPESLIMAAIEHSSRLVGQAVSRVRHNGGGFRCFGTSDSNLLLPGCFTGLSGIGLALMDQVNRDDRLPGLLSMALLSSDELVSTEVG